MDNSQKFCLKWNDFQKNIDSAFGSLRKDEYFSDVTLASEDGEQIEAHKVVLAASSPFFQNLLKKNKHAHPLIVMRGVKSEDLVAILDFLYYGETNIDQENLDSFLNIAEELSLKGLSGRNNDNLATSDTNTLKPKPQSHNKTTPNSKRIEDDLKGDNMSDTFTESEDKTEIKTLAVQNESFIGDLLELDEKIKSMMVLGQNMAPCGKKRATVCQVCGKEGYSTQIRDHIEANHVDGVSIPCTLCEKTFRSRSALRMHKSNHHK